MLLIRSVGAPTPYPAPHADTGGERGEEAVAACVAAAAAGGRPGLGGVKAGRLEWSCRGTAEHIASDLIAYAGQFAGRAQTPYVPFEITSRPDERTPPTTRASST